MEAQEIFQKEDSYQRSWPHPAKNLLNVICRGDPLGRPPDMTAQRIFVLERKPALLLSTFNPLAALLLLQPLTPEEVVRQFCR